MATTVKNNTLQGRNFHWLDTGGFPQATFINAGVTVNLTGLTGSYQGARFASAVLSAADQAMVAENVGLTSSRITNFPLDFTVA